MPLILPGNVASATAAAYDVANSCRFNDGDSASMTKTSGSGDRRQFTISAWVKRGVLGTEQEIYGSGDSGSNVFGVFFNGSDDKLSVTDYQSGGTLTLTTNRVFRDCSAWMNIVVAIDTDQGTEADRVKIYVNGVQETSFSTENYPSQNTDVYVNVSGQPHNVGVDQGPGRFFDGYMAEVVFIDGTQYAASDFGEFDSDSPTIWKPKDPSGLTFGTNGFYLDFEASDNLGNDANGGTDLTESNLDATDQATDTPTNNFATLNPLLPLHSSTFSEGNCKWTLGTDSQYYWSNSTFGLSQGKWYFEAKLETAAAHNVIGISVDQPDDSTTFLAGTGGEAGANDLYEWGWKSSNGNIYNNTDGGASYGNTYTTGDILGMYLDLDNNKLYFAKNGTIENSGTGISITAPASTSTGVYFPCVGDGTATNASVWETNFGGCPAFAISSGNTDANGYGNFEYDPSDGGGSSFDSAAKDFYALCTKNLAEYG